MPEYASGRPDLVKNLFENLLFHAGILRLKKDGKGNANPLRYTRRYQVWLDGERIGCEVTFMYDAREEIADVSISYLNFMELKLQERKRGISNERVQVDAAQRDTAFCPRNGATWREQGRPEPGGVLDGLQKLKGQPK